MAPKANRSAIHEALDRLAKLLPLGSLKAATDPAGFIDDATAEIERLRAEVSRLRADMGRVILEREAARDTTMRNPRVARLWTALERIRLVASECIDAQEGNDSPGVSARDMHAWADAALTGGKL